MQLSDFDFDLPQDRIATRPARPRSSARMLVGQAHRIDDAHVFDLPDWLNRGDRLIINDTKVIPARLTGLRTRITGQGPSSAKIQATLLAPLSDGTWAALIKPLRKLAEGEEIIFANGLSARLERKAEGQGQLRFNLTGEAFDNALTEAGDMPLPPYIEALRPADDKDRADYQTVWAARKGAVAAPTASLHFDQPLLDRLAAKGITFTKVTLHVGAGTFLPVKVEDVKRHKMHAEWGEVNARAAREVNQTKADGGRVIPVGTTALRLIETAARATGRIQPWQGKTDIFIYPGFPFRVTDALVTNFHLPKSTLLMLVSALMGRERLLEIYDHAVASGYRFFSYGDASLLIPQR